MTRMTGLVALLILAACGGARADDPFLDQLSRYFERIDTLSVVSGDARDVNAVTHIIDPWPRYVGNRRIPGNGQRMVGAVDRYQNANKVGTMLPTLAPVISSNIGSAGDGTGGGMGYAGVGK
jgi:hypothetical protein